jgi:formylglycine-generating enzyme required for sulfatase activity
VEQVSWDDATEFCLRLGAKTGRNYRLPSEAEWEYACRTGTTTPFHYGETLSDDLANYSAQDTEIEGKLYKGTYGRGIQGKYRQETTEVGLFPPNPFGLYDMHGNVWEWCADDWHDYTGAPRDGSVWLKNAKNNQNMVYKLLRGGSWYNYPRLCRSASREYGPSDSFSITVGFRVCCVVPIALLSS